MSRPIPATDETHGPFRKVVSLDCRPVEYPRGSGKLRPTVVELLECGHRGKTLLNVVGPARAPGKRRRCGRCGTELEAKANEAKARIAAHQNDELARWRRTREGQANNDEALARRRAFVVIEREDNG